MRWNLYSVLSLPLGARQTPRVHFPAVASTQLIGVVQFWSLPCVKRILMSGLSDTVCMTG